MTMTSRERFAAMLNHKAPDRMPVYPLVNSISRQSLGITYEEWTKDINKCAEAIIRTTDELELDCLCTLVDLSVEAADFGQELLYFKDKAACPDPAHRVVPTEGDYDKIPRIDPAKGKRMSEHVELCRKLVEARGKDKPVVAFVFGPLGIVSMLRGQQEMFMDLYTAPDEVKKGVEIVSDVLCDWIDQLCATGIDAVMFDTLYASRSIMSAEMWDEFEGVYMTRIAERVRSHGCAVMIHNCGQGAYFDEQYERMKPVLFSFAHPPQGCADMKEAVEASAQSSQSVEGSRQSVKEADEIFTSIQLQIEALAGGIQDVSNSIQTISEGTKSMSGEMDSIASISHENASRTQSVSATTEEQSASSEEIAASTRNLSQLAEDLQGEVHKFKV